MLRTLFTFILALSATLPLVAEDLGPDTWDIRLSGPGSGIQKTDEGIALFSRPHLVSKRGWYKGTTVSLEAKPSEAVKADDGRTYGDALCVVIRSTGKFRDKRSYEALDGIFARIDFVTGDLYLQTTKDGETFENLAMKKGQGTLSHDEWHSVSIKDTDDTVTLTVGKVTVSTKVEREGPEQKGVWSLYNREPVGPGQKVLQVQKVVYTTPPR